MGIKLPELRQRVDNALEKVSMTEYKNHSPALLSGGQKQRVAIAGVLAMSPKCIIFDEPTAMLDPVGRKEIVETVLKLHREQKTIIYVTHYMEEIINADRVYVLNDGEIFMEGTPRQIFENGEELEKIGLDVPVITKIATSLRKKGYDIRADILSLKELVDEI